MECPHHLNLGSGHTKAEMELFCFVGLSRSLNNENKRRGRSHIRNTNENIQRQKFEENMKRTMSLEMKKSSGVHVNGRNWFYGSDWYRLWMKFLSFKDFFTIQRFATLSSRVLVSVFQN